MKKLIYLSFFVALVCINASAQVISTTAPFNFGTGSSASNAAGFQTDNMVVSSNTSMPAGVYNFVNFTINAGVTVTVTGSVPLIVKCTGACTISGVLTGAGSAGGSGSAAGTAAGGGGGGAAGAPGNDGGGTLGVVGANGSSFPGSSGGGTGGVQDGFCGFGGGYAVTGGSPNAACKSGSNAGVAYGNAALTITLNSTNILGGSGGGAGSGSGSSNGGTAPSGGGGGGGGGIAIVANSITITTGTGLITVKGGAGGGSGNDLGGSGGGGSGGTVLLQYAALSGTTTVNSTAATTASNGIDISGGADGTSTGGTLYTGGNGSQGYYLGQQACSGIPSTGAISATLSSVCATTTSSPSTSTLSLPSLSGADYSFQWQVSGTSGSGYTNVASSGTGSTYTTPATLPFSPTSYYICNVTCANGGASTATAQQAINYNAFDFCYCKYNYTTAPVAAKEITNVGLVGNTVTLSNTPVQPSAAPEWVQNYSTNVPDLTIGQTYTLTVKAGTTTKQNNANAWIDFDQNGTFGSAVNEFIGGSINFNGTTTQTFSFTVPATATSGQTALRVNYDFNATTTGFTTLTQATAITNSSYSTNSACTFTGTVGSTYDFLVNIVGGCTTPTTQASNFVTDPSPTINSCNVMFTRGNGTGGMIVVCKAGSAPSPPAPGTAYSNPQANITAGGSTTASGSFVIYNSTTGSSGTQITVPASGLTAGTTYYFAAYEWNTTANCYNLVNAPNGTVAIPLCIQPTVQASGQSSANVDASHTTISWTGNGNGDGGVIVFLKQGSAISTNPSETVAYTGNSAFQSGSQIASTGAYAVYTGSGSSVTVSNLSTNLLYFYAIYAYNSSTNCYMTPPVTGSFTSQNSPMAIVSSTTTQSVVTSVTPNSSGNQIIGLQMVTTNGTSPALTVSSITFNTNGSTNAADIASATIYYTGTVSTFSAINPFGSPVTSFPGGSTPIVVTGSQTLTQNATNYFWIAYTIAATPTSTLGDVVDAEIPTFTAGAPISPSVTAPSGNRQILLVYCTYNDGSGYFCPTFVGINAVGIDTATSPSPNTSNLYNGGGNCYGTSYGNFSSTTYNVAPGSQYILTTTSLGGSSFEGSGEPIGFTAYLDISNDGVFTDAGDQVWSPVTSITSGTTASFTFTVPSGISAGGHRLRVITYQLGSTTSCAESGGGSANAFDFTLNVIQPSYNYNVHLFLQGYYMGGNTMSPLLHLLGAASTTAVDTVTIELHNPTSPYATVESHQAVLTSNGTVSLTLTNSGTYYIVAKHRNSIDTWSASPITLTSNGTYDFTTGANKAYGNNQASLGGGVFGIYSGDVNKNGSVNSSDKIQMQSVLSSFSIGVYNVNDITGDGFVDDEDYRILENNVPLGITVSHP